MPALILLIPVLALFAMTGCGDQRPSTVDKPVDLQRRMQYYCIEGFVYMKTPAGHADAYIPIFDKADRLPKRCDG